MKVLLVNPYQLAKDDRERRLVQPFAPLGPLYIASILEKQGHKVKFYDATFERSLDGYLRLIDGWGPQIVGSYSTFLSRDNAIFMAQAAKERGILNVAGGPEANVDVQGYLNAGYDIVVNGEGEITMGELVREAGGGRDWARVDGISYQSNIDKKYLTTQLRPRNLDLDSLPLPARHLVDIERYRKAWMKKHGFFTLNVLASRGCPFDCGFCSRPVFGRKYSARSVENVLEELKEIKKKHSPDRVRFVDDNLLLHPKWMRALCDRLASEDLDLEFECLSRVSVMDRDLVKAMRKAGFRRVFLGVESGSPRVLKRMCKDQRIKDIGRASMVAKEEGIDQHWFMMLGYPGEELDDIEQSMALMERYLPDEFSTTVAYPIKGTRLHSEVKDTMDGSRWTTSGDNKLVFKHRYPERLYKWTILRMRLSLILRRNLTGGSPLIKGFDVLAKTISRALAGEGRPVVPITKTPSYDMTLASNRTFQRYRDLSTEMLLVSFKPGMHVLDIGCGTGEEALLLASKGVHVTAIDISKEMLDIARSKIAQAGLQDMVDVREGSASDLLSVRGLKGQGPFDGAYSSFGVINCVSDLEQFSKDLSSLLRPGAPFVTSIMNRSSLWEILAYMLTLRPRTAFRRFKGTRARIDGVERTDYTVRYYSPQDIRSIFDQDFSLDDLRTYPLLPPPYFDRLFRALPGFLKWSSRKGQTEAGGLGDHMFVRMHRSSSGQ